MRSSSVGAGMRPDNEKSAGNTLCIGKGFEEVWAYSRPSEPCFLCCVPVQNKIKTAGWSSLTLPLLAHTSAFSSRQTDSGKLMTFLSATEHAHGHHTHAHLAHHHSDVTLHVSFPPSVIFPAAVFRSGWWNHNAMKAECQPLFCLSAFSTKNLQHWYAIS